MSPSRWRSCSTFSARLLVREQEARARLEGAEAKFRSFLESAPDGIVVIDRDGRIVLLNSQTEHLFGYARDQLLGQPVELLVPERRRQGRVGHRDRYLEVGD